MSVFVGIDAGGSSCRVMAVDSGSQVLFQGRSGAANLATTPEPRLRRNLTAAAAHCPSATRVCGCFAGLINEPLKYKAEQMLHEIFPGAAVRAEPDYAAAFCASPQGTDLCIIAGTGSLVCSRAPEGIVKSGGRGYILGDFGSGFQFGRDALVHYLDHPTTCSRQLRTAVQEVFGMEDEGAIVASLYGSGTPAAVLAKLARPLGQDAQAGEAYALESLTRNFGQLVGVVAIHVERRLPSRPTLSVSLAGGVWKASPIFMSHFEATLRTALPSKEVKTQRITQPPIIGAVALAQEESWP